jgi:pyrimidine nucleoside transport protein
MNAQNLIGISGLISYILLSIILSVAPHRIKWRPVIWGIGTQYVAAVIVLHTKWGYAAFEWLGEIISKFVSYAAFGIEFLFGSDFPVGNFAFAVLPIIVFFSMVTSMLYYVGFLQYIIKKLAWLFSYFFGTTGPESMTTVGNMFLSMTESPLLIKPHINNLTNAEIFAVMTAGFASIAGSVLGGYIALGISAAHLLTATVMSAPAALAIAKIIHPEVQVSRYAGGKVAESEKLEAGNIIEAASKGISEAISVVLNVAANLLGFVAIQNLLDDVLAWLGNSVDQPGWSFSGLLGYIFYPFVIVMGIEPQDAIASARLVGTKTFFNEFIAFLDLSEMIKKRESGKV